MADITDLLASRLECALYDVLGDDTYSDLTAAAIAAQIRPSSNDRFGDYQANIAMSLGKKLGRNPRELAQALCDALDLQGVCERIEVAGPGFINLHLDAAFINERIAIAGSDKRLGIERVKQPQTVVVDYSGPNVAKEMHVGHLRSTVIGDAISRVFDGLGHTVIRQNHIGDWGTQFGMLIEYMLESGATPHIGNYRVSDLNTLYQDAKKKFDAEPEFARRARERVVLLQGRDIDTANLWGQLISESYRHFDEVYRRLDVKLGQCDVRGESAYNDQLSSIVEALETLGLLKTSEGAQVVFPAGFKDREGEPMGMIVRKGDGGYLYATTDLAAARYRVGELHADRIIYITDSRQSQHFAMVFAVLRQTGWAPESVRLDHVPFGTVLGKDNRPFKTRSGDTVKLKDLLDEAEARASAIVDQKSPDLPSDQKQDIAHKIGIGALKYADLSSDRVKDYVFDWDRMLAFEGNTAPYLQNAYVRVRSIFRKGGIDPANLDAASIRVADPAERGLAIKLLQFPAAVKSVTDSLEPHRLCTYLYELATALHRFYEKCPVLTAKDDAQRASRLALCRVTADTLARGLGLLGIGVVEQM